MSDDEYGSFDEDEAAEAVELAATTPARLHLQQRTLFGGLAQVQVSPGAASYSATRNRQRNRDEPATHHQLDREALKTWVYPTNYPQRDYQFNMIKKALFTNLLVALPTGLGKTFVAAVVMYNWFRWAPESKIIFLAPAKPLVTQQIEACYHVCGIPALQLAELTGGVDKARRITAYQERRVFFLTPQTFQNDLRNGLVKAKEVSCLVIDEAHHATGNYAYNEVIRYMRAETESFRILALTATPGKSVDTVQEVIDGLNISQIEIRSETSLDIRSYVHTKEIETILIDLSPELEAIQSTFADLLRPMMKILTSSGVGLQPDPTKISTFHVKQAVDRFLQESRGRGGPGHRIRAIGTILSSLANSMTLLTIHGVKPFYDAMVELRSNLKTSELKKRFVKDPKFPDMMRDIEELIADPSYTGHPKLDHLSGIILRHFQKAQEVSDQQTRVMVFSSLRASAEVIVATLKQHSPLVKPTPFFGQQPGKSGSGMSQKEQQETINKFKKGDFNVIVATSVGEEGLDIGEVDMIICYDSSSSPSRMLQRMGRTGRKRDGQVFVLCVRGKEEMAFHKAKDAHKVMQKKIENGIDIKLAEDVHRIVPWNINPVCEKRLLEVPAGDKIADLELKTATKRRREAKAAKIFTMPDGVVTGFVTAGALAGGRKRKRSVVKAYNVDALHWDFGAQQDLGLLDEDGRDELDTRFRKIDQDHAGCQIDRRGEEGMFLGREEAKDIGGTVLVGHGRTTRTIRDLTQKRFEPARLRQVIKSYQATIDAGQDLDTLNAQMEADELALGVEEIRAPDGAVSETDQSIHDSDSYSGLGQFIDDSAVKSNKARARLQSSDIEEPSEGEDPIFRRPPSMNSLTTPSRLYGRRSKPDSSVRTERLPILPPTNLVSVSDTEPETDEEPKGDDRPFKKMRLSQLAKDSDDEELPDTVTAIKTSSSVSKDPPRRSLVDNVAINQTVDRGDCMNARDRGRGQGRGRARTKIRITDDDEDD